MLRGCADDDDDALLFAKIKSGKYDMGDPVWNSISDGAKSLVSRMLCVDAAQRLKSSECLQDEWLRSHEAAFKNAQCGTPAGRSSAQGRASQWPRMRSERQNVSVTRLLCARSVRRQGLPPGEGEVGVGNVPRGEPHTHQGTSYGSGSGAAGEPGSSSAEDVAYIVGDAAGDVQGSNEGSKEPSRNEQPGDTFLDYMGTETYSFS
jgi:serine/threonine protein kinase